MSFFLIYNIVITCKEIKGNETFIFFLLFFTFLSPEDEKFYSINKEFFLFIKFFM